MGYRKRGDRWLVTVELGRDERGVRRRKHLTCTSEEEAKREDAVLTAAVLTGTYVEDSGETMAEFLEEWLRHAGRGKERRTVDAYAYAVNGHLVPYFKQLRLSQLRPLHVERFMTAQAQKGLAQATVDKQFWVLHKALDRAVAWGRLQRNPADGVEKPGQQESDARSFDVAEQAALLGRCAGNWLYGPVLLALATGMRRGEVAALAWRDVDLAAGVVRVRSSVVESSGEVKIGRPKTAASSRSVRIPPTVCEHLADHREKLRLLRAISTWKDHGLVFPNDRGGVKRPSVITGQFHRVCSYCGITDGTFHMLRHTFATEMLVAGVPVKVVSEMLGHASVAVTLRIYAHVLETMQEAAVLQSGAIVEAALRLREG